MKLAGVAPGQIEDRRYAMFGLADKTIFSPEEYNVLKAKYPDFETFWSKWEAYTEKLKEGEKINAEAREKDRLQAERNDIELALNDLQAQLNDVQQAIQEKQDSTSFADKVLVQIFEEKKSGIVADIDAKNARLADIDNRIAEIDAHAADYSIQISTLRSDCEAMITSMGGTLPF